jgi:hypothetical protein
MGTLKSQNSEAIIKQAPRLLPLSGLAEGLSCIAFIETSFSVRDEFVMALS